MNTKRQYSLPNCNLILEGLEDADTENADILDGQYPLSILINAECNFLNSNQKLSGVSVFLENLARAVSNYAQGFLSGLPQPKNKNLEIEYPRVSIAPVTEQHVHRLTFEPEPNSSETKTEVNLTTVELFDLVDAIDRFYSDRTALPNMTLELQSVSKRHRMPEQPIGERLTPAIVGFSSLIIAAGAFFVIPPPKIENPTPTPVNQTIEQEENTNEETPPTPETDSDSNSEQ